MESATTTEPSTTETITVTVTVDTDELREWAGYHADAGHAGVAHVLYKAAAEGESLGEQALREAEQRGADKALADAAAALGTSVTMPVLIERESCDWWSEQPVARWLLDRRSVKPGVTS